MKKRLFFFATIAVMVATLLAMKSAIPKDEMSVLMLQNIEALTAGEFNPVDACDTYCKIQFGYVCVLSTSAGFNVYCDDMATWM